jgi:hypothetical protein
MLNTDLRARSGNMDNAHADDVHYRIDSDDAYRTGSPVDATE